MPNYDRRNRELHLIFTTRNGEVTQGTIYDGEEFVKGTGKSKIKILGSSTQKPPRVHIGGNVNLIDLPRDSQPILLDKNEHFEIPLNKRTDLVALELNHPLTELASVVIYRSIT